MNPARRQLRSSQRTSAREIVAEPEETAVDAPTQPLRSRKRATPAAQITPRSTRQVAAKKAAGRGAPRPPLESEEEEEEEANVDEDTENDTRNQRRRFIQQIQQLIEVARGYEDGLDELQDHVLQEELRIAQEEERHIEQEEDEQEEDRVPTMHIAKKPKKRKDRVAWTEDEETFLANLIAARGPTWTVFETKYGRTRLAGRSQTAMKDKARNMMRAVIDNGEEEEFIRKYPKWAQVSVGQSRRGVHAYEGEIPDRRIKRRALALLDATMGHNGREV